MLARPRASITVSSNLATSRTVAPLRSLPSIIKSYSTEAEAAAEQTRTESNGQATDFEDLRSLGVHDNILRSITRDMGYKTMTPVQAKTINPALKGTDIVAQAKTGTGKTIAFLLPLLQRMLVEDPTLASRGARRSASASDIRGIIMSPTRELAEQIANEARALVRHTGLVVQCAVGGTNKAGMLRQTQREGCHLLVATPGRLNDLLEDERSGIDAPNLAALVLDEADRMLDVGFEKELESIVRMLPDPSEKIRQTMLVSATIPDDVIRLARTMVRPDDFEFVQTIPETESLTHDKVPQKVVPVNSWSNVFPSMLELIEREQQRLQETEGATPFKAIVYFNTTAMTELAGELGYVLRRERLINMSTFSIHSKLSQMQRTRAADGFRKARSGILFSSDVTARGMDFPDVTHVIQVDSPRDRESYIHRLGRTGRQNKDGQGWLFLPPSSVSMGRRLLKGLPLQQDKTLESASHEIGDGPLPEKFETFRGLVQSMPKSMLAAAYQSLFGNPGNKEEMAEDLYHWVVKGWGWPEPPLLSPRMARNMGLDPRSQFVRIGEERFGGEDRGRGGDRGGRFGPRGGGGGRRGGDAFDDMRSNARTDSFGGRGGRRGGGHGRSSW